MAGHRSCWPVSHHAGQGAGAAHRAVALAIGHRQVLAGEVELGEIRTEAGAVRVGIGDDVALQPLGGRGLDAGHEMRRAEGGLLDVDDDMGGIAVQEQTLSGCSG